MIKTKLVGLLATASIAFSLPALTHQSLAQTPTASDIAGVASVVDGDTIEIHGTRIRLSGYDTPERGKRCGDMNVYQKAAFVLSDFIGARTVICKPQETDRHGRTIATCAAGGIDLGSHMVRSGWGRDWPRYSEGKYADDERVARQSEAGLWGLTCEAGLWSGRNYD